MPYNIKVEPKPEAKGRDTFIDWARLSLALSVVALHRRLLHGYIPTWAVDAFLGISGYYVLQSYEHSRGWVDFAKKRILRVVPAFVLSFLLLWLGPGVPLALATFNYYLHAGTISYPGPGTNYPAWSLMCEEVAYGALAILFALSAYKRVWPIWIALLVSLAVARAVATSSAAADWARIADLAPAFFAGSLVYLYRNSVRPNPALGAALVTLAIAAPLIGLSVYPVILTSTLAGTLMGVGILLLRSLRMPHIPDLSYGCYILHLPLFFLMRDAPMAIYIPSLGVLCACSWYLIEKPVLKLKNWNPNAKKAPLADVRSLEVQAEALG